MARLARETHSRDMPSSTRGCLRPPPLRSQHAGHRKEQPIHKLVTHHDEPRVHPINCQDDRPDAVTVSIEKSVALFCWNCPSTQTPELPHHPQVQSHANDSLFDQQFQISVMRIQNSFFVSGDEPWQL